MKETITSIPCNKCRGVTKHSVLFTKSLKETEKVENETHVLSLTKFQVVICNGCDSITFLKRVGYPNYFDFNMDIGKWKSGYKEINYFYPERLVYLLEEKKFVDMPSQLRLIYREVIDGFNQGQRVLCAIGLRSLIEGTCRFLGVKGKNLAELIRNLENSEHLSKLLIKSLDSHRLLGNQAAHYLQIPEKEELIHAIDLVEQALVLIFNIPKKAERLNEMLNKRISSSKSDKSIDE